MQIFTDTKKGVLICGVRMDILNFFNKPIIIEMKMWEFIVAALLIWLLITILFDFLGD